MNITLQALTQPNAAAFAELQQLYAADLALVGLTPHEVHGSLRIPPMIDSRTWLIIVDHQNVGYVAVAYLEPVAHNPPGFLLRDIFVRREWRNQYVGRTALELVFQQTAGDWEIATPAVLVPAAAFFRAVLQHYTNGVYDERWVQQPGWRGPIQSFQSIQG